MPKDPDGLEGNCVDWYWVTIDNNTGETVYETYLYTECGGTGSGGAAGSTTINAVDTSKPVLLATGFCNDDYKFNLYKCERTAIFYTAAAFITAGGAIIFSKGQVAPQAVLAFEVAAATIISNYVTCTSDARTVYDECIRRANLPH